MTVWHSTLGDLEIVAAADDHADLRTHLRLITPRGDTLLEPVPLDHIPKPGARIEAGGMIYDLAVAVPVTRREWVDDGTRNVLVDVVTFTVARTEPVPKPKPPARSDVILELLAKFLAPDDVEMIRRHVTQGQLAAQIAKETNRPESTIRYRMGAVIKWMRSEGIWLGKYGSLCCAPGVMVKLQARPAGRVNTPGRNAKPRQPQPKRAGNVSEPTRWGKYTPTTGGSAQEKAPPPPQTEPLHWEFSRPSSENRVIPAAR